MELHRLTEKDLVEKTAMCSICGPTRLVRIARGGVCPVGHAETNVREYVNNDGSIIKLTGRQRLNLLAKFGSECNICGIDISDSAHLDHDHETGEFRGALCRKCNFGLGNFNDSQALLLNATLYLQRSVAVTREIKVK